MLWYMVLCHAPTPLSEKAFKATIHGATFASVPANNKVILAIKDIKDEVFWNAIYIFLCTVFPALKALRYCDLNVPAMDKTFDLVKREEDSILNSTKELENEAIFGPCCSATVTGCEDEFNEMYGEDD